MIRKRSWTNEELTVAVKDSASIRSVLIKLGLVPAGGNYRQVAQTIKDLDLNTEHFTGMGWRKNRTFDFVPQRPLDEILVQHSDFQSFKLKKRLFREGLKTPKCERCGWAETSQDGRIPVELDHINGDRFDNRLENLQILCPNCHSLQPTHRGMNQKGRGGEIGRRATLKML
jgi:5-methylcytosine-specific restriction endonuclease McrA